MPDGVLENVPVVGAKRTFPRSFGRYILEKSLSRGGMGEVFLTIAKAVMQRCVIKTIRGDLTGDEEFIGRFADEAKIMMRIQHENIIRVFDAGKVGTDYYIAMEYVHGRDLGDVLDRAYERGEPMPTQLGLYVADKLLDGMDYAHKLQDEHGRPMGVVHRDISPQNVLIGFDGSVKLIDFGLARTDLLPARTQGALAVGKYGYMSPEQARHEKIDGRADIYSTGVMLFEVFTGDRLVDEQDQATLWSRVLNPKHRKPSSVVAMLPKEIDDLVMTAVAVKTEDRFRDASEMRGYVQRMRNEKSNRDDFVRYLRYLYPKVDFSAPPVPDYGQQFDDSEKSMIIATSREGAMSVFGRGELPIEWTTQIDAAELQAAFAKYKDRTQERDRAERERGGRGGRQGFERDAVTDANITDHEEPRAPEMPVEPTWVKSRAESPVLPRRKQDSSGGRRTKGVEHAPTQVAELPPEDIGSAETKYARSPRSSQDEIDETPARAGVDLETEHAAPILGTSRVAHQFRDDEMTVMMDAPPRSVIGGRGGTPQNPFADEDTRDGDAPTRLSQTAAIAEPQVVPATPSSALPAQGIASRGRAIQERNAPRSGDREKGERTNLRTDRDRDRERERNDRGDRADRGERGDRDRDGVRVSGERTDKTAAAKGGRGSQRAAVAHRATVPTDAVPATAKRNEITLPPAGAPELTEPEQQPRAIGILPGVILLGLAVVIVLLVMLLLKV